MDNDEDLWSDEINAFVDRAFETVSLSPSFYGEVAAYRYAIKLAIDESLQHQTDAFALLEKYSYWIPAEDWKAIYDMRAKRQPQTDAIKLAIDESRKHGYDHGYYDGSTHPIVRHDALREALVDLLHAVCGEKGFAQAVRRDSGRIYPWPALELAEAKALAALEQSK